MGSLDTAQGRMEKGACNKEAYVTMVVTSDYVIGALVMAHSLRASGNRERPLLCMVTGDLPESDCKMLDSVSSSPHEKAYCC